MVSPKTSFTWWSFGERGATTDELLRGAAAMGYDAVELAPDHLWPAMTDAGLAIATHGGHSSIPSGLNRAENHDRIEREITANLELAQRWHIPVLICFSGTREGLDDDAGLEQTVLGLLRVAKAAEDAGVTLALELLNSKIDHPDYQCDHTDWAVRVVDQVNSPRVQVLYDVYHMQIMEGDIIRTITEYGDRFAHYHVAGNPGRHEPNRTQELWYPAIYEAINATGYDGYVGMEFIPTGNPLTSLQAALDDLRASPQGTTR
jgi:hydroxypyruvate isomerase